MGFARKKIVFFAAEPTDAAHLRLMEEVREIQEGLRLSKHRGAFDFTPVLAVRTRDLQDALQRETPHIVHFSGHGVRSGELLVEDLVGRAQPIAPAALANLFSLCAHHVECVVLNACYSEGQAKAIADHIPYVIGTAAALDDRAAVAFSIGFYRALGNGSPIETAFQWGSSQLQLDAPGEPLPTIKSRPSSLHVKTEARTLAQMNREQLSQLAQEYKRMLAEGCDEAETHLGLGSIYLHLGLHDLAVQHFRRTIDLDPALADGYYLLALAGLRGRSLKTLTLQDARAIERYLNTALQIDDSRAQYYYLLALLKEGYYAANGLRPTAPGSTELIGEAQRRVPDPGEVDRILHVLPSLEPRLAARIQGLNI
ncbi:MAG TPA: CHAT domain-containing protein [Thermoanaerobaculia bacterium]|nr:CHAT domain-containing protein [Thermoanaerobaculia bacterium]